MPLDASYDIVPSGKFYSLKESTTENIIRSGFNTLKDAADCAARIGVRVNLAPSDHADKKRK